MLGRTQLFHSLRTSDTIKLLNQLWLQLSSPPVISGVIILFLFVMFPLGYLESLRWPFPGMRATHGILKGLFLLLSVWLVIFRKKLPPQIDVGQNLVMVGLVLAYVLSAAFSMAPDSALLNLWYPFISLAILVAFSRVRLNQTHFLIILAIASLLVVLTFTFSFFSLMFRYSVDSIYYFIFLDHRANHLLSELRQYGKYVSLGPYLFFTPMLASFLIDTTSTITRKLLASLVLFVTVLTAVISNNRIDVLVLGIHMVVILFLLPRKLAVILLAVSVPIIFFGLQTTERFFGFSLEERILRPSVERDQDTITIRYVYWQTALYNFKNAPIFGTGPNTYNDVSVFPMRQYYDQGASEYKVRIDEGIGVHNVFFERLSDTGLVGFFAFITLLFYLGRRDLLELLKPQTSERRKKYILYALSSWSWILYSLTDNGYGAQGYVTFFFLRGLLLHV